MTPQRFEYVAVDLPWEKGQLSATEEQVTARLNAVAEHGWRLVCTAGGQGATQLLVFERPVDA